MTVLSKANPMHSKYMAFISHSHQDASEAKAFQRFIETYRIPMYVQRDAENKRALKHLAPVFLDRADLSAEHDLTAAIQRALNASRFLIVICSRHSRQSAWVEKEVAEFCKRKGSEYVIYVVSEREPANVDYKSLLPQSGSISADKEPVVADRRHAADGPKQAALKVIAAMLRVDLTTLVRRDIAYTRKKKLLYSAALLTLCFALGLVLYFKSETEIQRAAKETKQLAGEADALLARADSGDQLKLSEIRTISGKLVDHHQAYDGASEHDMSQQVARLASLTPVAQRQFPSVVSKLTTAEDHEFVYLADIKGRVFRTTKDLSVTEVLAEPGAEVDKLLLNNATKDLFIVRSDATVEIFKLENRSHTYVETLTLPSSHTSNITYQIIKSNSNAQADNCFSLFSGRSLHVICHELDQVEMSLTNIDLPNYQSAKQSPAGTLIALSDGAKIMIYTASGALSYSADTAAGNCNFDWLDEGFLLLACVGMDVSLLDIKNQIKEPINIEALPGMDVPEGIRFERIYGSEINTSIGHAVVSSRSSLFDWHQDKPSTIRFLGFVQREQSELHVDWYQSEKPWETLWVTNWKDNQIGIFSIFDFDSKGSSDLRDLIGYVDTSPLVTAIQWIGGLDGYIVSGTESSGLAIHPLSHRGVERSVVINVADLVRTITPSQKGKSFVAQTESQNTIDTELGVRNSHLIASNGSLEGTANIFHGHTIGHYPFAGDNRYYTYNEKGQLLLWQNNEDSARVEIKQAGGTQWGQWNRQKNKLFIVDRNNQITVWDSGTGRITMLDVTAHVGVFAVDGAYWRPDADNLLLVSDGNRVQEFLFDDHPEPALNDLRYLYAWESNDVWRVTDAVTTAGNQIDVWQNYGRGNPSSDLSINPSDNNYELVFEDRQANVRLSLTTLDSAPTLLGLSPDGSFAYAASETDLFVWNTKTKSLALQQTLEFIPSAIALGDQGIVAVASETGQLIVFSFDSPQAIRKFQVNLSVNSLSFSEQSNEVLVTSATGNAKLISLADNMNGLLDMCRKVNAIFPQSVVEYTTNTKTYCSTLLSP